MKQPLLALALSLTTLTAAVAQTTPPADADRSESGRAAAAQEAPAGKYAIDPAHATIGFSVRHLDIADIVGKFNQVEGTFTLGDQPAFHAVIPVKSVNTGVEQRDDHLRSSDFFNVEKFPTIEFKSTGVEQEGNSYTLVGDFTMHGETKEITLPLRYLGTAEMHGTRVGFTGETTIDRREWGLTAWQGMVGNDIRLIISFEGVRE